MGFNSGFKGLMHLVGFIIRIYHDALSFECQIPEWPLTIGEAPEV